VFKALYQERRQVRHTTSVVTHDITSAKVEHELNAKAAQQRLADSNKKVKVSDEIRTEDHSVRDGFPVIAGEEIRHCVISEWQLREQALSELPLYCAVCRYAVPTLKCHTVDPCDVDFTLLQNAHLPVDTLPSTYNLEAYSNAILYHKGLHSMTSLGPVDICSSCKHVLVGQKKQPLGIFSIMLMLSFRITSDKVFSRLPCMILCSSLGLEQPGSLNYLVASKVVA
jgi:hypothetical protein